MDSGQQEAKARIAGLYSRAAPTYDTVGPRYFARFGRRLVELAGVQPGMRVLDVASGRGAVLFPAAEAVGPTGRVTGIDIAEGMVRETGAEIARHGLSNVELLQMDAENLDFPGGEFDRVLAGFSIFFYPDPARALSEFHRVLKPGGRVGISSWGPDDERWDWYIDVLEEFRPAGCRPPAFASPKFEKPEELEESLSAFGFKDAWVISEETDLTFASGEEWWASQWTHGSRYLLEMLDPKTLERFKAACLAHTAQMQQPDGLHNLYRVLYAFGTK